MNYETRIAIIRTALGRFLSRYSPPRNLGEDAQVDTFTAICESINRHLPNTGDIDSRLDRMFSIVGDKHKTNAWPVQGDFATASKQVSSVAATGSKYSEDEPSHIYEMVKEWWLRFGDAFPSLAKTHHCNQLVREGVATFKELRLGGFNIPDDELDKILVRGKYKAHMPDKSRVDNFR